MHVALLVNQKRRVPKIGGLAAADRGEQEEPIMKNKEAKQMRPLPAPEVQESIMASRLYDAYRAWVAAGRPRRGEKAGA